MKFDMARYIEAFNTSDEETVVNEYYCENVVVEGPDRTMHGRQAWIDILKMMHDGIDEKLDPLVVLQEGDALMAELDAEFTATKDRPEFLHGSLKKGESVKVRFFASYRFEGELIARLALAWWPPHPRG